MSEAVQDGGEYDDAIEKSKTVQVDFKDLLLQLRNRAATEIEVAKSKRKEMDIWDCTIHAKEWVDRVESLIVESQKQFDDETRHYHNSIDRSEEAKRIAQEGITEAQRQMAKIVITEVETLMGEAISLESEKWVPDEWEKALADLNRMNRVHEQEKNYIKSRELAELMVASIKQMIVNTWRRIANAAINDFERELEKLISDNAKLYLESDVNTVERTLAEAKNLFEAQEGRGYGAIRYNNVRDIANKGLDQVENVWAKYNTYTIREIRLAQDSHDVARQVFNDNKDVFLIKESEYIKRIDLEFENNKETLQSTIDATLKQVDESLKGAEQMRSLDKKYHEAIVTSREGAQLSNEMLDNTYNVVAHNAINEVADQLSRWESDGGQEYAATEIAASNESLTKAIDLRNIGQYRNAIESAAESRWKLDFAIQKVKETSLQAIETAEEMIQDAVNHKAEQFTPEMLDRAESEYKTANDHLNPTRERLKDSIESAKRAQTVARRAKEQASELWTRSELEDAIQEVRLSQQAGAAEYAVTKLNESEDQLDTAQKAYEAGRLETARLLANKAEEAAITARYAKINDAYNTMGILRRYDGFNRDPQRATGAINRNKAARGLMQRAEDFDRANDLADEARQLAEEAIDVAKQSSYEEQLEQIEDALDMVLASGARYYQTDRIREMLREADEIRRAYRSPDFTERFDALFERMQNLYKDLNDTLASTEDVLDQILAKEYTRIERIEELEDAVLLNDRLEEIKVELNIAEVEFKHKNNYAKSYQALKRGDQKLNKLENGLRRDIYLDEVRLIVKGLSTAKSDFDHILQMNRRIMKQFSIGNEGGSQSVAIAGRIDPFEFRNDMDRLYGKAISLEVPEGMGLIQRELVYILTKSRQAALNFEKLLILDEFGRDTAVNLIERAYNLMDDVNTRQQKLGDRLLHEGTMTHKVL